MASPKPVAEVRIGPVKAAIWRNETANSTSHNVTFSASTRTAISGRRRKASLAMICCYWRRWPIRPTRASSGSSRKNSRSRRKADLASPAVGLPSSLANPSFSAAEGS